MFLPYVRSAISSANNTDWPTVQRGTGHGCLQPPNSHQPTSSAWKTVWHQAYIIKHNIGEIFAHCISARSTNKLLTQMLRLFNVIFIFLVLGSLVGGGGL